MTSLYRLIDRSQTLLSELVVQWRQHEADHSGETLDDDTVVAAFDGTALLLVLLQDLQGLVMRETASLGLIVDRLAERARPDNSSDNNEGLSP